MQLQQMQMQQPNITQTKFQGNKQQNNSFGQSKNQFQPIPMPYQYPYPQSPFSLPGGNAYPNYMNMPSPLNPGKLDFSTF